MQNWQPIRISRITSCFTSTFTVTAGAAAAHHIRPAGPASSRSYCGRPGTRVIERAMGEHKSRRHHQVPYHEHHLPSSGIETHDRDALCMGWPCSMLPWSARAGQELFIRGESYGHHETYPFLSSSGL